VKFLEMVSLGIANSCLCFCGSLDPDANLGFFYSDFAKYGTFGVLSQYNLKCWYSISIMNSLAVLPLH